MKKKRFINLNRYNLVDTEEAADLIVVPLDNGRGETPINLYFAKKNQKAYKYIDDVDTAIWEQSARISTAGSQEEYNRRVDWWFDGMEEQYKQQLVAMVRGAVDKGFDIGMSVGKARMWLKNANTSDRKTRLSQFITNWITTGVNKWSRGRGV